MTSVDRSRWTAAAAAALGLTLVASGAVAWFSFAAEASTADLNLSVSGDDRSASLSADGKQLTFSAKQPLGSAFSFQHRVTVSNTGDSAGTGTISLGTVSGSPALARAIHGRVIEVTRTTRTLLESSLQGGGTIPLDLPAHSAKTVLLSFSLNCAPLGTEVCADVSDQSVTAVLQLAQKATVPVITAPPVVSTAGTGSRGDLPTRGNHRHRHPRRRAPHRAPHRLPRPRHHRCHPESRSWPSVRPRCSRVAEAPCQGTTARLVQPSRSPPTASLWARRRPRPTALSPRPFSSPTSAPAGIP